MNDVKVTRVFREAWIFVTEYYFVWLRVGLTGPF